MSSSRSLVLCAWMVASLFYAYQFILRVMPNIMLADITSQFDIGAAEFGQFSGAFYLGYCLFHIPIGILVDRFGPKKVMSGCILLTVIGSLPVIFAETWAYPVLGRVLIGIGSSASVLGAFKIIRIGFKPEHFTRMLSITVTIGLLGAIYGGLPVGYMVEAMGHKTVVAIFASVGVAFAIAAYFMVPEIDSEESNTSIWSDLKTVLSNKKVLFIAFMAGLMVGPMEGFADAWGSEYLKKVYGFEGQLANSLTSMIYIGMCFAPLLSRIAEKTGQYIGTIAMAGILMFASFTALELGFANKSSLMVSFFITGICCAYQILAIYKASTYVPEHVSGLTSAITNMIIMSFGYVFHSSIGFVIAHFEAAGDANAFVYGISIIPATLLVGAAGFMGLFYLEKRQATLKAA